MQVTIWEEKGKYIDNYLTMNDSIIDSAICLEKINSTAYFMQDHFSFVIFFILNLIINLNTLKDMELNDVKFWPSKILKKLI